MFREFCIILLLTAIGAAYTLFSGLLPLPRAEAKPEAGEIRLADAQALNAIWVDAGGMKKFEERHIPEALLLDEDDGGCGGGC